MAGLFGRQRWRSEHRLSQSSLAAPLSTGRKLSILGGIVVVCFLALSVQLFRLQVLDAGTYEQAARENRLRKVPVPAPRGLMYDRNGKLLVRNQASFSALLVPGDLPAGHEGEVYAAIQDL